MPASEDSRSDHALSDTLSARSYLELATETSQIDESNSHSPRYPIDEIPVENQGNPIPSQRPRTAQATVTKSEKSEMGPEKPKGPHPPDRPARKRGRPRLETAKDAAAIEVTLNCLAWIS